MDRGFRNQDASPIASRCGPLMRIVVGLIAADGGGSFEGVYEVLEHSEHGWLIAHGIEWALRACLLSLANLLCGPTVKRWLGKIFVGFDIICFLRSVVGARAASFLGDQNRNED